MADHLRVTPINKGDEMGINFKEKMMHQGISRRDFLKFCGFMAATLGLPMGSEKAIAQALAAGTRPPIIWLEFQDCTADSESFLREPTLINLLFDSVSLDYHETLMAPSGAMADKSRQDTVQKYQGQYICVVEGSIPTGSGGVYAMIGGRTALSIAQEVCTNALATIAVGNCAWDGGIAAAAPNPTGALGVGGAIPGLSPLINLPGCPMNVVNLTATIVYFLTNNQWPALDSQNRPQFAYGQEIHEHCPRHDHFEAGRFVLTWGDQGHRNGWCLFRMGCKGPRTKHNCWQVKWNGGTNWPIEAGHGCVGCASPNFWDQLSPFYVALPDD
jgi:hydrogenase small subunit